MGERTGRGPAKGTRATALAKREPLGPISAVCKYIKGGKQEFMRLAVLASQIEPALAVVVETWEGMNDPLQRKITIEEICRQKDVDPGHFCGVVVEAAMKFRDNATILIAALNLPDVVQRSVEFAKQKEGFKDREALMKHAGFVPTPQGQRINILNQANAKAGAEAEANAERGLPTFERTMAELEDD
jgi:hypothetical protein